MTYEQTLDYLYTQLPMYQRVGKKALKPDLSNTIQLLEVLGNPHLKFKSVHIAGTNGKGTSAHALSSILQTAGYCTGLYTSPHLKNFTERIRLDGQEIPQEEVIAFTAKIKQAIADVNPSFFEITVTMAFDYFARQQIDIAIIETGLGGRLDSTNVIIPEVSLITNIGLDHMDLLGDTHEKIAVEKAGIIKHNVPVVVGESREDTRPVFDQKAKEEEAPLVYATPMEFELDEKMPDYFKRNIPGIMEVCHQLAKKGFDIQQHHVREGIRHLAERSGLKGRFQILQDSPLMIADVSHNADGLEILFDQVKRMTKGNLYLVFGTVKDKELEPIFKLIPPNATIYWTQSSVPRALAVNELATEAEQHGRIGQSYQNVNEAMAEAKKKAQKDDTILVTGSTFVVAEIDDL